MSKQHRMNYAAVIAATAGLITSVTALLAQWQSGKSQYRVNKRMEARIQTNSVAVAGHEAALDYIGGSNLVKTAIAREPEAAGKIEQANEPVIKEGTK